MKFVGILLLLSQWAYAGSHDDLIPGSAFFRFRDIYGVYVTQFSTAQPSDLPRLQARLRLKKISGYTGLIWLYTDHLGQCHGRYKLPIVVKIKTSAKPVVLVSGEGECYLGEKKQRFSVALYFPHIKMSAVKSPMQAIFWLGGISGSTLRFEAGTVRKVYGEF